MLTDFEGGERKRVSIAEMAVGHAQFSAWDNRFVTPKTIRKQEADGI